MKAYIANMFILFNTWYISCRIKVAMFMICLRTEFDKSTIQKMKYVFWHGCCLFLLHLSEILFFKFSCHIKLHITVSSSISLPLQNFVSHLAVMIEGRKSWITKILSTRCWLSCIWMECKEILCAQCYIQGCCVP